jgi:hypothetical protein
MVLLVNDSIGIANIHPCYPHFFSCSKDGKGVWMPKNGVGTKPGSQKLVQQLALTVALWDEVSYLQSLKLQILIFCHTQQCDQAYFQIRGSTLCKQQI